MRKKISRTITYRSFASRALAASIMFAAGSLGSFPARAASEEEVRTTFANFVTAQNAHDVKAVQALLWPSPDFLWITRGTAVWGVEAALRRFTTLYQGTWRLDPENAGLKIVMLSDSAAQLYIPVTFAIGAAGQPAQQTKFLMNQVLVKTTSGWKVSSILPIPAPAQ